MRAYQRFLEYIKIDTRSREEAELTPSSPGQHSLARKLEAELRDLGMQRVRRDENAYVYGWLPSSPGYESSPTIGLIAHMDTSPDFSGDKVCPRFIENYDGGEIELGQGLSLSPEQFPDLPGQLGNTLIVTDGSTLLGADDKAGIAEIMTLCERLIKEGLPHCGLSVCFCPDEETGHGAALLDIPGFGADFAYTIDGDAVNEINYETFNAASARWEIKGRNVHPGSAKDIMLNASLIAMEINSMLPSGEIPARTQGYQGFFHLTEMKGSCESAELRYIIRDHDGESFAARKELMEQICREINRRYGPETARLSISGQYANMADFLKDRMEAVERAMGAMEKLGIKPDIRPVRGGTDGAQLSARGLPCPNLGTGGYGFHGPYEHISVQDMDRVVELLVCLLAEK